MSKAREYSFGFKELKFMLFNRKFCNICGTKMKKMKNEKYIGKKRYVNVDGIGSDAETYEIKIFYYCPRCNKKFSLEELLDWRKGNENNTK
ncbi:hypothetical protein FDF26_12580 [Clostridium botulinum]|nr:hypothetical protein [Clostridium botulinum]